MPNAARQSLPDSFTWGFAGAPIQIHLRIEVVSRLRQQIEDSAKRGAMLSACGLLTGEAHKPGVTTILDFEPLPTLDAASVGKAIDRARGDVVGFYRTTSTGLDSMPDDDKALAANLFSHPSFVFLQVDTGKSTVGDASFCFWGEGKIFDFPVMMFPFDAAELAAREGKRRLTKVPTPTRSTSDILDDEQRAAAVALLAPDHGQEPESRRSGKGWLIAALVMLLVASAIGGAILHFRPGSNPPVAAKANVLPAEAPSPLGLSVERKGKDLRVSWNGNADKIAKAEFGMLLIRGSGVSRDVPLTAEELRSGSVVYSSSADQLRFQLTVVSGGLAAREFLTIVMPEGAQRNSERASNRTSPASSITANSDAGQAPRPPDSSGRVSKLREFKQTRDPGTVATPGLAEPPPINVGSQVNTVTPSLLNQPAVSPVPPVSSPAPVDSQAQGTRPGQSPLSGSEAQPPLPTRQVVPPVPALLRGRIWKATTVDVTVFIDGTGNVVKAEAVAKEGLHPLLRDAAVQAALRWRFQPAQFNGHAVPANMVLQFNFAPSR